MKEINLMPWREEIKTTRRQQFFLLWGSSLLIVLVFMLGMYCLLAGCIHKQEHCNNLLENQISMFNQQIKER